MKKLLKTLAITTVIGAAALAASDAKAWWGWGPWGGGPFDGSGLGDFNLSFRGSGSGYGYGHPYYGYGPGYWGGGPWGGYGYPYGGGYPGYWGAPYAYPHAAPAPAAPEKK